jgi:hypothetical protein
MPGTVYLRHFARPFHQNPSTGLVVDRAYEGKGPLRPYRNRERVVFDLKPATHQDEQALHEHAQAQAVGLEAAG